MPARVRLALMVFASLAILAAAGVILFARPHEAPPLGASGFAGALSPPDIPPKDFTLTDEAGKRVSLRSYRGHVVVLTFMYSTCQDTCPVTATTIRGALDELGHDVPAPAVSVDPAHDIRKLERERSYPTSASGLDGRTRSTRATPAGIYQFQRPNSDTSAGTRMALITVASSRMPAARPVASTLTSVSGPEARAAK